MTTPLNSMSRKSELAETGWAQLVRRQLHCWAGPAQLFALNSLWAALEPVLDVCSLQSVAAFLQADTALHRPIMVHLQPHKQNWAFNLWSSIMQSAWWSFPQAKVVLLLSHLFADGKLTEWIRINCSTSHVLEAHSTHTIDLAQRLWWSVETHLQSILPEEGTVHFWEKIFHYYNNSKYT